MEGIPAPDVADYKRRKEIELGLSAGSISQPQAKRPKVENRALTEEELKAQLEAHKALMGGHDSSSAAPATDGSTGGVYGAGPQTYAAPPAAPAMPPPSGISPPPAIPPGAPPFFPGGGPPPGGFTGQPPFPPFGGMPGFPPGYVYSYLFVTIELTPYRCAVRLPLDSLCLPDSHPLGWLHPHFLLRAHAPFPPRRYFHLQGRHFHLLYPGHRYHHNPQLPRLIHTRAIVLFLPSLLCQILRPPLRPNHCQSQRLSKDS